MYNRNIELEGSTVLITGVAGFIGASLTIELLKTVERIRIVGIDNMNDYYDVKLKRYRLDQIAEVGKEVPGEFVFLKKDIANKGEILDIFSFYRPRIVVNFAAQAGVRYSIENPDVYIESNLIGFYNILEGCRHSYDETDDTYKGVEHFIYASSSSVYGNNKKVPYSTEDRTDYPISLYAATKKSNELLAYTYSKLYGLSSTGLRFFTVYGPAGRPDMAYFKFADKFMNCEKIQIYNYGNCRRDFTYIDDVISGIMTVIQHRPLSDEEGVKYKIYNIGNNHPETLLDFVSILQEELKTAKVLPSDYDFESYKELVDMQPGDVEITFADITDFKNDFGFTPSTSLKEGLKSFVNWYKEYYKFEDGKKKEK